MLKLLTTLEALFTKYTPWHSEAEMREALDAIQEVKDEVAKVAAAPTPEAAAVTAVEEVPAVVSQVEQIVDPTVTQAATTVVAAGDSIGTARVTDPASVTLNLTSDASASTVPVNAPDAPVHIPEPEPTPFPGSYTPPPAS